MKKEKIQEAYGSLWEYVSKYVDEDGWCRGHFYFKNRFNTESTVEKWRPRILNENNGWMTIESESDFPTEDGCEYWLVKNGKIEYLNWEKGDSLNLAAWLTIITHWQKIIKPKLPRK